MREHNRNKRGMIAFEGFDTKNVYHGQRNIVSMPMTS